MYISSRENAKVKLYCKLLTSRKARREYGAFTVEGVRNCADIAKFVQIETLFCTEEAMEKFDGEIINKCSQVFTVSREAAEKMSDVGHSQGAFAIVKCFDKVLKAEDLQADGRYLVLDDVQDPGNLGTMIRTAAAVGINGVILAGNTVDLYNPKVVRSAMGSMPLVELYIESDERRVFEQLSSAGIKTYAAVVSGGTDVTEIGSPRGCAVVIGNEGRGLSEEAVKLCTQRVTITMNGDTESLNAAIAGTILLWEMSGRGK